jgi:membrane fusion protein (multidrug efflux system)
MFFSEEKNILSFILVFIVDDLAHPISVQENTRSRGQAARWLPRLAAGLVVAGLIAGGTLYYLDARHYESTDDAFIDGDISQISAQIGGRVTRLLVQDNQAVAAGQLLVELDPRDQQMRLDQMAAQRDQAKAGLDQAQANLPVRQAELSQAAANVHVAQAELLQSQRDLARYTAINPRAISAQTIDSARAAASTAQARLDAARQAEAAARAQLAVLKTQVASAAASLRLAEANVANAQLQLSYTRIVAPADGRIARRTVELGNYIAPGQALMAVVQRDCWVTANFKESQLADMHPGQTASIAIDALGGRQFAAHVASLQPGTGSVFSSLPAENATGNYVKIVQRLPVKLTFDGDACRTLALAPGMSVEPSVKVR